MQNNSLEAISHISPHDLNRKEWVSITMSFKADGGTFEEWKTWNSNYWDEADKHIWKDTPKVSPATLYYHAKQNGYKPRKLSKEELEKLKADRAIHDKIRAKQEAEQAKLDEADRITLQSVYNSSSKVLSNSIYNYFRSRGIDAETVDLCPNLRSTDNALLTPYMDSQGEFKGLHRTFINDGVKTSKNTKGKHGGDFVCSLLTSTGGNDIHISEGLEDLLTVLGSGIDGDFIFMVNAGNLAKFKADSNSIINIWADADDAGVDAVVSVAVNNPNSQVMAHFPPNAKDWNAEQSLTGYDEVLRSYHETKCFKVEGVA